jgi:ABC-type glycerol-3-phosphate transport system permease component
VFAFHRLNQCCGPCSSPATSAAPCRSTEAAQQTSIDQINGVFAGAVIAIVPLVILLLFFQRHLVRGLTAGAVKG